MEDIAMVDAPAATNPTDVVERETFHHFMELPLEIRRKIYVFAADREYGSKYVLKVWLDKVGGYGPDYDTGDGAGEWGSVYDYLSDDESDDESDEYGEDDEYGGVGDELDDDDDEEESEDEGEHGDGDGQTINAAGQEDGAEQVPTAGTAGQEDAEYPWGAGQGGIEADQGDGGAHADDNDSGDEEDSDATPTAAPPAAATDAATMTEAATTVDSAGAADPLAATVGAIAANDASTASNATIANPAPRPVATVATRRTPNRHTVGMFGLNALPPPVPLLQAIKNEVKEGYFSTAFFYINVTKGVRHITFFEDTLKKFYDAAFSPLEQVRKMEINVHWNSQWLKDHENRVIDDQGASSPTLDQEICEGMLGRRMDVAAELITKTMPAMHLLEINWHDVDTPSGSSHALQSRVLANFWEIVGYDRMHQIQWKVHSSFTQLDEPKDRGVLRMETEFEEMLHEMNGGWI